MNYLKICKITTNINNCFILQIMTEDITRTLIELKEIFDFTGKKLFTNRFRAGKPIGELQDMVRRVLIGQQLFTSRGVELILLQNYSRALKEYINAGGLVSCVGCRSYSSEIRDMNSLAYCNGRLGLRPASNCLNHSEIGSDRPSINELLEGL